MRILRLQFKNLNSLYGEWEIDFTNNVYQNNSLFLLSGPTGAGKSTILDAIGLALYGQTPRLGKITQSSNEIMSKHTADCYALLHFETKGIQYYARFEQKRARNKLNGKLQDVERSIAKDTPDNIICRKKTDINEEIIRITGMDFPRFTRSILLAQGAFDSFLKAKDEEKSMLLEQITGTEIYSEISKAVFERAKQENEKTNILSARIENTSVLPQEEIENLQKNQNEYTKNLETVKAELNHTEKYSAWLNKIQELHTKIENEQKQLTELHEQNKNSNEKKIALAKAQKAEILLPEHAMLIQQKKELQSLEAECINKEKLLPAQKEELNALTIKLEQIQNKYDEQKKCYEEKIPLFNEIREMDIILETMNKSLIEQHAKINDEKNEQKELDKKITQLLNDKNTINEKINELKAWQKDNQHIETLKQELSAIKQKFSQLAAIIDAGKEAKNDILSQENALKNLKEKQNEQDEKKKALHAEIESSTKQEDNIANNIMKLLNNARLEELQKDLAHLNDKKILLAQIASLEEQRKKLLEGQPCPLCGATTHPYITEQALPSHDAIDTEIMLLKNRINEIEQLLHNREKLNVLLGKNKEQFDEADKNLQDLTKRIEDSEKALQKAQNKKTQLRNDYEKQMQALEQELAVFHIPALSPQNTDTILRLLQEKCTQWDAKNKEKQEIDENFQKNNTHLASCKAQKEIIARSLEQKTTAVTKKQEDFNARRAIRQERFGQKNPAEEEQKLQKEMNGLEKEKKNYLPKEEQLKQEVTKTEERIKFLQQQIKNDKQQLSENNKKFLQKITEQGFASQDDFLNAVLEQDTILQLKEFLESLERDIKVTEKQLNENKQEWEQEKSKQLTQKSLQEIEEQKKELQETRQNLLSKLSRLTITLEENEKAVINNQENIQKLKEQKAIQEKWDKLNRLIGSADGKKFRTIAQAITFEHVIQYANTNLQLLQERYILTRDEQSLSNLNLKIIDNYQGGEARAVQNLSGGESFIVSLSLALGLAQMASQNVQVDSLFLDEGFGTLDEENLDTALSTLASMQQEGKLIGVISHISLLKERITTQINIKPQYSGKSILEGAGCKKLA